MKTWGLSESIIINMRTKKLLWGPDPKGVQLKRSHIWKSHFHYKKKGFYWRRDVSTDVRSTSKKTTQTQKWTSTRAPWEMHHARHSRRTNVTTSTKGYVIANALFVDKVNTSAMRNYWSLLMTFKYLTADIVKYVSIVWYAVSAMLSDLNSF